MAKPIVALQLDILRFLTYRAEQNFNNRCSFLS